MAKRHGISLISLVILGATVLHAELKKHPVDGYTSTLEVTLPGSPEVIYDAMTGEIGGWWDHHFSESPKSFRIEPKPGGGFYEIFDDAGNGVLHGTVIYADRGKRLTFRGPLGFNGRAVDLVATWTYEAAGDSTTLSVKVEFTGQVTEDNAAAIDGVWHHFIIEGLKPYVESGKHLKK
jgi:hypothetical protein